MANDSMFTLEYLRRWVEKIGFPAGRATHGQPCALRFVEECQPNGTNPPQRR